MIPSLLLMPYSYSTDYIQVITKQFQERCPVYSKTTSKPSAPQLQSNESIHRAIEENIEIKPEMQSDYQSSIVKEPKAGSSSQFVGPSSRNYETNRRKLTKEDYLRQSLLSAIKEKIIRQLNENIGKIFNTFANLIKY